MGLRFFQVEEKIRLGFTRRLQESHYQVKTKGRSLGFQAGFMLEYNPYPFLTWGGVFKLGALFHRGRQETLWLDDADTLILLDKGANRSSFAYCGQVYPFIQWRPTKFFDFYLHYQVLYLGGAVVADSQLVFDEGGRVTVSTNGDIIYHGMTLGVQCNF